MGARPCPATAEECAHVGQVGIPTMTISTERPATPSMNDHRFGSHG
jgi:hypothetical protein